MDNNLPGKSEFTAEFFEESSRTWMENKIRDGQMLYYKCNYIHKNNKRCSSVVTHGDFCKRHYILKISKK